MIEKNEIVLFTDNDIKLEVPITPEQETVWLTQEQMSVVFEIAHFSIAYQIGNIFKEGELDKSSSVEIFDRSENKASRSRHGLAEIRWQNCLAETSKRLESILIMRCARSFRMKIQLSQNLRQLRQRGKHI